MVLSVRVSLVNSNSTYAQLFYCYLSRTVFIFHGSVSLNNTKQKLFISKDLRYEEN